MNAALLFPEPRVTIYAAIDPADEQVRWVREALNADVVELESTAGRVAQCGCCLWMPVRVASLGSDQQARVARALAPRCGIGLERALFEIKYGVGLWMLSKSLFVCRDPAVGRGYWARKGGGA